MKNLIIHFKKMDWVIIACSCLLASWGIFSIYSSSFRDKDFSDFKKQIIFFAIGLAFMFFLSMFDWREFRENPYLILALYILGIILLAGLFVFAPKVRGVRSWYKLGPVSFDPVEFMKVVLIILLAKYFSMRHVEMYRLKHIILSGFYVLLPAFLGFLQPELGSTVIMISIWLGILLVSGIKVRHFLLLALCGILIMALGWSFLLKDYQKTRITSFIFPSNDPMGSSWSQNQSKIAIGSGGIFGKGFLQGSQARSGFLPEPHTDFIFSAVAEEYGFLGILVLLALFSVLIWRIMKIVFSSRSNFPRLFSVGFIILLVSHILINAGMNLGLLPVVGIPFPFLSYGGSSLLALFAGLGILQSVKTHGA